MTIQREHRRPRPSPSRPDELPAGLPDAESTPLAFPPPPYAPGSPEAREAAARGGRAKRHRTALADELGLDGLPAAYRKAADNFAREQKAYLRRHVGGGELSPAVRSFVSSAALQLAGSRWLFDQGQAELGSKLADSSRQNLLAAHELAARDAQARRRAPTTLAGLLRPAERAGGKNGSALDHADQKTTAPEPGAANEGTDP